MLSVFEYKRAECLEEIAECEKSLELAKLKLEWLDELIADAEEEEKETAACGSVAMYP